MNSQVLAYNNQVVQTSPISWVLVGFVLFFTLRLALLGPDVLGDPDTFLHIAIGDWVRSHGVVPLTDPFSYPMAGEPWIAHEWLAGLIMSYAYTLGGWYGVCVLAVMSCAVTLVILARYLLKHLPPVYVVLLVVMANAGLESHLLARPHVLAWPLMALWVSQLLNRAESGRMPPFWLLPLLVLWANLHGSFSLAIAFVPPLALEAWFNARSANRRRVPLAWAGFLLLAVGASLITPFGWHGLAFTSNLVSIEALESITEWQPLTVKGHPLVLLWLGLFLVLGLRGWLQLPWIRLALIMGLGWQMLMHARFYSIFALLVPLLIAAPLAVSQQRWSLADQPDTAADRFFRWASGRSRVWALMLALGVVVAATVVFRQPNIEPGEKNAPRAAVTYLQKSGQTGHGLNYYNYGGYLIWSGIPVFMDGRIDLRGDAGMKAYDAAITRPDSEGLSQLLDKYAVTWTLFPKKDIGVMHMDRAPGWQRVYEDDQAVVHARLKK